jgi:alpha-mannosidase
VTAVKPAEEGEGVILRVLNPTDQPDKLELNGAFGHSEASVRLDESPLKGTSHEVPPHALRTWRLRRR